MCARLEVSTYEFAEASRLTAELSCSHVLAQVLVRRGLGEPEAARAFLEAGVSHPLSAWPGLARTAWRVLEHVERGSRITIHGDYDVDGVCSTAILVRALRTLGADVDWYLPSRIDDGYGLAMATVERMARVRRQERARPPGIGEPAPHEHLRGDVRDPEPGAQPLGGGVVVRGDLETDVGLGHATQRTARSGRNGRD